MAAPPSDYEALPRIVLMYQSLGVLSVAQSEDERLSRQLRDMREQAVGMSVSCRDSLAKITKVLSSFTNSIAHCRVTVGERTPCR